MGGRRRGRGELLASCYRRAIELAAAHDCRVVAFPAISTGVYGFPPERAAPIAVAAIRAAVAVHGVVEEVHLWAFSDDAAAVLAGAV